MTRSVCTDGFLPTQSSYEDHNKAVAMATGEALIKCCGVPNCFSCPLCLLMWSRPRLLIRTIY